MAYPLAVLLIALSVGITACAGGSTTAQPQPPSLRHDTGLACISPPSWAPDGHAYALVGTTRTCSTEPDKGLALFLFDGASGQLLKQLPLASAFPSPPADGCPVHGAPYSLCLAAPLWSPDGQTLALVYVTPQGEDDPNAIRRENLLLVRADGSGVARLPASPAPVASSSNGSQPVYSRLWDLQAKTVRYFVRPESFSGARSISWGPHGTLVSQPATTAERAPAPVGNPMGGASFSPWQAGQLQATTDGGVFDSGFSAWSPDGRYIALGLGVEMRITTGAASTQNMAGVPVAPRDAGLTRLLKDLAAAQDIAWVMWNAAGTRLLAIRCTGLTSAEVRVLSTATGATLAQTPLALDHERTGNRCGDLGLTATWDADGRAVVISSPLGGMLLWHPTLD